jgi:hypothetical protein
MPGGSVYKDHAFNKETAPNSHETAQVHFTNIPPLNPPVSYFFLD